MMSGNKRKPENRLRCLATSHRNKLSMILESHGYWKKLAEHIINRNGQHFFNIETIKHIETKQRNGSISPLSSILDAWSTDNPTIEDLLNELVTLKLYRAADFVSMEVLGGDQIPRPGHLEDDDSQSLSPIEVSSSSSPVHLLPEDRLEAAQNADTNQLFRIYQQNCIEQHKIDAQTSPKQHEAYSHHRISLEEQTDGPTNVDTFSKDHISWTYVKHPESSSDDTDVQRPVSMKVLAQKNTPSTDNEGAAANCLRSNTGTSADSAHPARSDLSSGRFPQQMSYSLLEEITNKFNPVPLAGGGNLIGSGGFGQVFKGVHSGYPEMAIKRVVLQHQSPDECQSAKKQFATEITTLSRCDHINILDLIGWSNDDAARWCIVYKYMCNLSLEDQLANSRSRKRPLSIDERLSIVKGVVRGLCHLHSFRPPYIHRDVKSANILLDKNLTAKIGDCGTVRLGPSNMKSSFTETTQVIGTRPYMAPEYLEDGKVSEKIDAYSFGVVLLEVLTSLPAYDEHRDNGSLVTHIEEELDEDDDKILELTDKAAGAWCPHLVNNIFNMSKSLRNRRTKIRPTIIEESSKIESW